MVNLQGPVPRGDLVPSGIVGLLGTQGPTARTDIARALGLSPATVTQVTKDLIARGLVEELESVPSKGGRPSRLLGLVSDAGVALGAKVTADHVAVVTVELDGTVRSSTELGYDPGAGDAIERLGQLLAKQVAELDDRLLGVGVGVPGAVDSQASGVVDAPTLGWQAAPVGAVLRAAIGTPVLVDNDVNTLAAAERLYGIGRDHSSYLVVTIGRGIGCGIVVDGGIYRGANGGAGEIGHIPVWPSATATAPAGAAGRTSGGPLSSSPAPSLGVAEGEPQCTCGSTGCLEAHIGSAGLLRTARARGVIGPRGTAATLLRAATGGDPGAQQIFEAAGSMLGRALAGVIHTVDPEVVVLMGEGVDGWEFWQTGFEPSFRRSLLPARKAVPVVVEPWTEVQWARGAASLVLSSPFDSAGNGGEQSRLVRARLGAG
ncbi:ROK family transcriptional regulator [Kribbella qitaiheensis]|uniref:ROK family transcriptional regulator n=1 Tax=Kribbella qitaiheensis TaxID=1544730 RepID=A0A7G6X4U3_9ACTN|nr:ROK family transcriptional regulator [Kribbella qitaiheensis]QNE21258.1 ROK family transcriptional regulator [Kribbella qitaiheensis]